MDPKELQRLARERRLHRLVGARMLSPFVRELEFAPVGAPVLHNAGQYANFYLQAGMRSYSIVNRPNADHRLTIAVTKVDGGSGSAEMHTMEVGHTVEVDGPWGLFTLGRVANADVPLVFVATGTGLAPILAMMEEEAQKPTPRQMSLVVGCRHEEDRIYSERLAALPARVVETVSRGSEAWAGARGRVQEHLPALLDDGSQVLICGLREMVEDVRSLLKDGFGFDRTRIHTERFD